MYKSKLITFLLGFCLTTTLNADWLDRFKDPNDGALDLSEHLLEHQGFLPVPIIITEPALGYGGGVAAVYFSESMAAKNQRLKAGDRYAPPNISALAGFKTENGSWGAGGGVLRSWDQDRYRYSGGLGKVSLNLDYYDLFDRPRSYQLDGIGLVQQLSLRILDTDWLLGGRYIYLNTQADFSSALPGDIGLDAIELDIAKLGLLVNYDSRNNILTPSEGTFMETEYSIARDWLGSDREYENLTSRLFHYRPLGDEFILGLRGDYQAATENTPFFLMPFIDLRGIPALRYQGRRTAVGEVELRWNITDRWSLLGFTGAGRAYGNNVDFSDADTATNRGLGIRYLIARRLGLYAGLDAARGPEEGAVYIQVGTAWR